MIRNFVCGLTQLLFPNSNPLPHQEQTVRNSITKILVPFGLLLGLWMLPACSPSAVPEQTDTPQTQTAEAEPASPQVPTQIILSEPDLTHPWDKMPEVEFNTPLVSPIKDSDSMEDESLNYFPAGEPTGIVIPLPEAVWQAGWMNGRPSEVGAEIPPDEYGPHQPETKTIHLYDPNLLPPFLEPGQTLLVHLPKLKKKIYRINVGLSSENRSTKYRKFTTSESVMSREIHIRWNDRLIWKQRHAPLYAIVGGVVSPDEIRSEGNTLSIYNSGTKATALDVVWIEQLQRKRGPYGIILRDGEWLNRNDSAWVKQVLLHVSMPSGIGETDVFPWDPQTPEHEINQISALWPEVANRFRNLNNLNYPDKEILKQWIPQLRQALNRGMLPSVYVDKLLREHPQNLKSAGYIFGGIVQFWVLDLQTFVKPILEQIQSTTPDAIIYTERWMEAEGLPVPMEMKAWDAFEYLYLFGGAHRKYFEKDIGEEDFIRLSENRALQLKFSDLRAYDYSNQNYHCIDFHKSLVEGLMYSQHTAIVQGGEPGGPFFPSGSDMGSHHWNILKHVFRFGGPEHRKSQANLLPANQSLDLGSSTWAVADNGKDSVHVLIHNPTTRKGHEAILEVPLPWSGPTHIIHHQVSATWSASTKSEILTSLSTEEVPTFSNEEFSAGNSEYRSWFRHPLKLQGMHLLELSPEGTKEKARVINAPEVVGYDALEQTDRLFTISRRPPPPWWSRENILLHHRTQWKAYARVPLNINVDATLGNSPDWQNVEGSHLQVETAFPNTSPLQGKSTRFTFPEDANETRGFVYALYDAEPLQNANLLGIWVRALPPADFDPPPDWYRTAPPARFYIGHFPKRQLIEIEYNTWVFLISPAAEWDGPYYLNDPRPRIHFQHDPKTTQHPIVEINDVSAYTYKTKNEGGAPTSTLGFVRETESGKLAILLVGVPNKKGIWRQRLDRGVNVNHLEHIVDEALVVSAETPEEDPPESINASIQLHESSNVLEIEVQAMPIPPSDALLEAIKAEFPLIAPKIEETKRSAVLWIEKTPAP